MYDKGYSRDDIVKLYRFIDWVMRLPEELEDGHWQQVQSYEEAQKMTYVTYAKRRGLRKGLQQGRSEGADLARRAILEILDALERGHSLQPDRPTHRA